jgi:hypothetical protein
MPFLRVINNQAVIVNPNLNRDRRGNVQDSILLDKIDESQGNTEGYAQKAKQKLYVPYSNPVDPTVRGYIDLVQTDNVKLAQGPHGVITGLRARGLVDTSFVTTLQTARSFIASAVHTPGKTTVTGTTFLSVTPDITYITLTTPAGISQTFTDSQLIADQLSDLVDLTNQIQTMFNNHASNDAGAHGFHTIPDAINAPVVGVATNLATAITQLNLLATAYEAHRVLVGLGPVHTGADAANALVAGPAVGLASALALSNDLKAKFNAHRLQGILVHPVDDTFNDVTLSNGDSFSNTVITIDDFDVVGGPVAPGWTVRILANSKLSLNHFGVAAPEIVV